MTRPRRMYLCLLDSLQRARHSLHTRFYYQISAVDALLGGYPVATQLAHNRYLLSITYLSTCVQHTYCVLTTYIVFTTCALLTTCGTLLTTMPEQHYCCLLFATIHYLLPPSHRCSCLRLHTATYGLRLTDPYRYLPLRATTYHD